MLTSTFLLILLWNSAAHASLSSAYCPSVFSESKFTAKRESLIVRAPDPELHLRMRSLPEIYEVHEANQNFASDWIALQTQVLAPRGREGRDRIDHLFDIVDQTTSKTIYDYRSIEAMVGRFLKKSKDTASAKLIPNSLILLNHSKIILFSVYAHNGKFVRAQFDPKTGGQVGHTGPIGNESIYALNLKDKTFNFIHQLVDIPESEYIRYYKVDYRSSPRFVQIYQNYSSNFQTWFDVSTGKKLYLKPSSSKDQYTLSSDGTRVYVESSEADGVDKVLDVSALWGNDQKHTTRSEDILSDQSVPNHAFASSPNFDVFLTHTKLGHHEQLSHYDMPLKIETREGKQFTSFELSEWKPVLKKIQSLLEVKGTKYKLEGFNPVFSQDGSQLSMQVDFQAEHLVRGRSVETLYTKKDLKWFGTWNLKTGESWSATTFDLDKKSRSQHPELMTAKVLHSGEIKFKMMDDGTFLLAKSRALIKKDGSLTDKRGFVEIQVVRKKPAGEPEYFDYLSEELNLDALHVAGSEHYGVHSLSISQDGTSIYFRPTGNGVRFLSIAP